MKQSGTSLLEMMISRLKVARYLPSRSWTSCERFSRYTKKKQGICTILRRLLLSEPPTGLLVKTRNSIQISSKRELQRIPTIRTQHRFQLTSQMMHSKRSRVKMNSNASILAEQYSIFICEKNSKLMLVSDLFER